MKSDFNQDVSFSLKRKKKKRSENRFEHYEYDRKH